MALTQKDREIIAECEHTDEPIFVLRGKDILAATSIARYRDSFVKHGPDNPQFVDQVSRRLHEFQDWQNDNIGKVKYPD
jgi:hypothetical protein